MKFILPKLLLMLALLMLGHSLARSQTLVWGSPMSPDFTSRLSDSEGNPLDDTFVFEIGTFDGGFEPTTQNVATWATNWRAFDAASFAEGTYDPATGYVTGTADMNPSGFSNSPDASSGSFSFAGMQAYLWVRNSSSPVPGTQWALVRATNWTFPAADPECCPGQLPVVWSVSDLSNEVPVFGGQQGIEGGGYRSVLSGTSYLQTHTFQGYSVVPEPSSFLLAGFGAWLLARRRRN